MKDIKTKEGWRRLLGNPWVAGAYESGMISAAMAANAAELKELEEFLPALVAAERERRNEVYYSGRNGTAYEEEE